MQKTRITYTEEQEAEISICHFCNSHDLDVYDSAVTGCYVYCKNCNCQGPTGSNPRHAFRLWEDIKIRMVQLNRGDGTSRMDGEKVDFTYMDEPADSSDLIAGIRAANEKLFGEDKKEFNGLRKKASSVDLEEWLFPPGIYPTHELSSLAKLEHECTRFFNLNLFNYNNLDHQTSKYEFVNREMGFLNTVKEVLPKLIAHVKKGESYNPLDHEQSK